MSIKETSCLPSVSAGENTEAEGGKIWGESYDEGGERRSGPRFSGDGLSNLGVPACRGASESALDLSLGMCQLSAQEGRGHLARGHVRLVGQSSSKGLNSNLTSYPFSSDTAKRS